MWNLKACTRCSGDVYEEGGETRCWQCGHILYPPVMASVASEVLKYGGRPTLGKKLFAKRAIYD